MGATAVAFGAFGAHGLKSILTPELLDTYKTGLFYHLIHSIVLLVLSISQKYNFRIPYYFIISGIILFSFSLYIYSITSIKVFAMITPIGGICLLLGWLSIIISLARGKE